MVSAAPTRIAAALHFFAEPEGFAQTEVGGEVVEAGSEIDRNGGRSGSGIQVKLSQGVLTGLMVALVAKAGRSL